MRVLLWLTPFLVLACGARNEPAPSTPSSNGPPDAPESTAVGEWDRCMGEIDALPTFRAHVDEIRQCYESRLRDVPTLTGAVQLLMHVAADGTVDGVDVSGSLHDRDVFVCIRDVARAIRFPPVSGGTCAVIAVPLTFTPSTAAPASASPNTPPS